MGTLSSLTDEHRNVTTYEDGEAFASGLDVHMAVAGRQWSRLSRAALVCTWPSQGASGADFNSLYFLPQDANVLRTDANPPVCAS